MSPILNNFCVGRTDKLKEFKKVKIKNFKQIFLFQITKYFYKNYLSWYSNKIDRQIKKRKTLFLLENKNKIWFRHKMHSCFISHRFLKLLFISIIQAVEFLMLGLKPLSTLYLKYLILKFTKKPYLQS